MVSWVFTIKSKSHPLILWSAQSPASSVNWVGQGRGENSWEEGMGNERSAYSAQSTLFLLCAAALHHATLQPVWASILMPRTLQSVSAENQAKLWFGVWQHLQVCESPLDAVSDELSHITPGGRWREAAQHGHLPHACSDLIFKVKAFVSFHSKSVSFKFCLCLIQFWFTSGNFDCTAKRLKPFQSFGN